MRNVVVIGAGFIGAQIASHLARRGERVRLVMRANLDITDLGAVARFFAGLDRVDVLVNAAGSYGVPGRIRDTAPTDWRVALDVNLVGVQACCHYALRVMPEGGHILNLAGGGKGPMAERSAYAAAKSGLWRFTETLAAEEPALRVNAIAPGPMWSGMQQSLVDAGKAHLVRGLQDGEGAVPVDCTLRVVDHVLDTNPSGQLFFARDFEVPEPAVA